MAHPCDGLCAREIRANSGRILALNRRRLVRDGCDPLALKRRPDGPLTEMSKLVVRSCTLALEFGGVLCDEAADLAALLEDRLPLFRVERDREAADPVQGQSPFHADLQYPRELGVKPALVSSLSRFGSLLGGGGSPERTGLVPSMRLLSLIGRPGISRDFVRRGWNR